MSREEVWRKIENEWTGMEMKKRYFPQVDQIQPCPGARHKQINRKELFFYSVVKMTYLETTE